MHNFADKILKAYIVPGKLTLAPGLTLNYINAGQAPVCQINVLLPGGTVEQGHTCCAQLAAEALCEGSKNFPGERLAEVFDFNGAWVRATASHHYIQVTLSTPSDNLMAVLPAFIDCIANPTFPDEAVAMLRQRAAANRSLSLEKVSVISNEAAIKMMVGEDNPYGWFPTPEDILATTRQQVIDFHHKALANGDVHIFMAGLYSDEALKAVADAFSNLASDSIAENCPLPSINSCDLTFAPAPPSIVTLQMPGAVQSSLSAAMPAPPRADDQYVPLRIAVTALGGYFGSRLMSNIREDKGYTYGINASLIGLPDGAFTQIDAQFDPSYTDPLIGEIKTELSRMADNPPTGEELRRVKLHLLTQMANSVDNVLSTMQHEILKYTVCTPDDYFRRQIDTILTITPDQIADISAIYLRPDTLRLAIASPI